MIRLANSFTGKPLAGHYSQTSYGHLFAGIYFIEVTSGNEVWRERLIVQ